VIQKMLGRAMVVSFGGTVQIAKWNTTAPFLIARKMETDAPTAQAIGCAIGITWKSYTHRSMNSGIIQGMGINDRSITQLDQAKKSYGHAKNAEDRKLAKYLTDWIEKPKQ